MDENIKNRNKNINRGFRKLDIWNEAIELYAFVKQRLNITNTISLKVKAQIESSIFSVHSNIAEGYSRRYLKENIQFNNIALASLGENYSQIYALLISNDIDKKWFNEYDIKHYSLENKMLNYNKKQIALLKEKSDWKDDYMINELIIKYESD
jgi:four helix bundle protein